MPQSNREVPTLRSENSLLLMLTLFDSMARMPYFILLNSLPDTPKFPYTFSTTPASVRGVAAIVIKGKWSVFELKLASFT